VYSSTSGSANLVYAFHNIPNDLAVYTRNRNPAFYDMQPLDRH
jgi:hypothetical protein